MKILLMSHVGTIQKRLEPVHEAAGKVAMLAKSGMTAVNGLTSTLQKRIKASWKRPEIQNGQNVSGLLVVYVDFCI